MLRIDTLGNDMDYTFLNMLIERAKVRNYKREYERYHSKPEQVKRRMGRNRARAKMIRDGKAAVGDGKDVHHRDHDTDNNDNSNLALMSKSKNRAMNKNESVIKAANVQEQTVTKNDVQHLFDRLLIKPGVTFSDAVKMTKEKMNLKSLRVEAGRGMVVSFETNPDSTVVRENRTTQMTKETEHSTYEMVRETMNPVDTLTAAVKQLIGEANGTYPRRKEKEATQMAQDWFSGESKKIAPKVAQAAQKREQEANRVNDDAEAKRMMLGDVQKIKKVADWLAKGNIDAAGDEIINWDTAVQDLLPKEFWLFVDTYDKLVSGLMYGSVDIQNGRIVK